MISFQTSFKLIWSSKEYIPDQKTFGIYVFLALDICKYGCICDFQKTLKKKNKKLFM